MIQTAAIITAAGYGKRYGEPKLFAEINGKSFIRIIIENLRTAGIEKIIAVVNEKTYKRAMDSGPDADLIINPEPEKGMITSVYTGLNKAKGFDGILIVPVDHPLISAETYRHLCGFFRDNPDKIIKPAYRGKTGHPVIMPYGIKELITGDDTEGGLNTILKNSEFEIIYTEVDDPAILKNINTAEDLK